MSQLIIAPCPVDNKTPCPVERTMIQRDELPYFCVFCQIRGRLEKTAKVEDWISWDEYIFRRVKQRQLPNRWKKPGREPRRAKRKTVKKRSPTPKPKFRKDTQNKSRGKKATKIRN